MHSTFSPIDFQKINHSLTKTEWSKPPSSVLSRIGRKEQMRNETHQNRFLTNLRKAFDEADIDNKGYLTQDEWDSSSIYNFIQDGNLTKLQYSLFFKRIDAKSEGKVTWNELVHYLLQSTTINSSKKNHEAIQFIRKWPIPLHNRSQFHREMVTQILSSYKTNEYITISSDSVRFWNANDLLYKRMINDTTLYYCGLVFESAACLAIATTNRRLLFYNLETLQRLSIEVCASPSAKMIKGMDQTQSLNSLKKIKHSEVPMFNIPTTLCIAENSIASSLFVPFFIGDDKGLIEVYKLMLPKRRAGTDFDIARIAKFQPHKGGITQISPVGSTMYGSSSMDKTVIFFSFNPVDFSFQVLQKFVDSSPISSFTYSVQQKCLATCGVSRDAYIWSQGSSKKISKLGSHYNRVFKILNYTTTTKENYILTLTTKKEFRLYDAVNYRMMKEWSDPLMLRPENKYSAILFDPIRCQIITAASQPVKWGEDAAAMTDSLDHRTHSHPIIGIFNAPEFGQLVTVDSVCSIKAWNINTGKLELSHMEPITDESSDVAAATLDFNGRSLITNTFKNVVTSWNYNSGSIIANLDLGVAKSPVSVIRCFNSGGRNYLVRGGWDKIIWLYAQIEGNNFELYRTFKGHTHDISVIEPFSSGIVSGSVNGEILLWSFDTSKPVASYTLDGEVGIETMIIWDTTLFVGDSNGVLHTVRLPRLEEISSFEAHKITVKNSLTSFAIDKKNNFFYSADTLGYVKKWEIAKEEEFGCYELRELDSSIFRCHRDEIVSITLVKGGEFLATSSTDMCVRLFRTNDFSYVNYFSDETMWDIRDEQTWITESPFIVDKRHFINRKKAMESAHKIMRRISTSVQLLNGVNKSKFQVGNLSVARLKNQETKENKPKESEDFSIEEEEEFIKEKKDQNQPLDVEKIERTFNDYWHNPPNYHFEEVIKEQEAVPHQPALKTIPSLQLNSRPNELMNTIRKLNSLSGEVEVESVKAKRKVKLPILVPTESSRRPKSNRRNKQTPFYTTF